MAFLLALALFAGPFRALCFGAAPSVRLEPADLPVGGLTMVVVDMAPQDRLESLKFLDQTIPFFQRPGEPETYYALIGAGLDCPPGPHLLTVIWKRPGGRQILAHRIDVRPKIFPEEHLQVPERMVEFPPKILKRVLDDQKAVREACAHVTPRALWTEAFIRPVDAEAASPFGLKRFFNEKPRSPHSGEDLRAHQDTPVRASNAGRVALTRDCYLSGKTLVLDHGDGLFTLYAHLDAFRVKEGQTVRRGQVLGLSGMTGRATGPHLHWGMSLLGARLDPEALLGIGP